jgi:Ca-activated chloride channel family protein
MLTWSLVTLMLIPPKVHVAMQITEQELRHLVMVLDVSPSMRLDDAGPDGDKSRRTRAAEVMRSFFRRVPMEQYRVSVIACYTGAKPVVMDTRDIDVVHNVLNDLPMEYAFTSGKTDIFAGLEAAAEMAKPWQPQSTTVVLVSDGDTVPATGMPKMPASVADVLVVGVGDPKTGKFINGQQSRQDTSTLRQVAMRLKGTYHNGNEKHLSTELLNRLTKTSEASPFEKLTLREYALMAAALAVVILGLLPVALHYAGTSWQPGVRQSRAGETKTRNQPQGRGQGGRERQGAAIM